MDNHFQTPRDTTEITPDTQPSLRPDNFITELMRFAVIALIIVFPVRIFIAQPFIVSGASMDPTFESGQYLIVDQISYRLEEPARGEVVIFKYPRNPSTYFIKRIIALPGERITIDESGVTITNSEYPEGFLLDEPYLTHGMRIGDPLTTQLGPDEYFVMGDNRDKSSDSRTWGVLTRDHIIGRAFLRLLPVTEAAIFPGKNTDTTD